MTQVSHRQSTTPQQLCIQSSHMALTKFRSVRCDLHSRIERQQCSLISLHLHAKFTSICQKNERTLPRRKNSAYLPKYGRSSLSLHEMGARGDPTVGTDNAHNMNCGSSDEEEGRRPSSSSVDPSPSDDLTNPWD